MSLLQPKYPIISPIRSPKDLEDLTKQTNEKIELLRQALNEITSNITSGASAISEDGTTTSDIFIPQYGQFCSITKQDLTTSWQDVANLVTSSNVTDVGLSTTGTNIAFAATGIYRVSYAASFLNGGTDEIIDIHANKNSTEIKGSYASDCVRYETTISNTFLVDITVITDTIHFEVSAANVSVDLDAINGAEADPTTRTVFNCTTTKIANT